MSDQDRYIREARFEQRRIVTDAKMLWMTTRHASGKRDYMDKAAVRTVGTIVERALNAKASWRDIDAAIRSFSREPIGRDSGGRSIWDLDFEIGRVAQERRERERREIEDVERNVAADIHNQNADADLAELRKKHPGMDVRAILRAEGLDPFHRPA